METFTVFEPQIEITSVTAMDIKIALPKFSLELDVDEETGDVVGTFEGPSYDVLFHGDSPEHVIGVAHRYASKLTEGKPYLLDVAFLDDDIEAELVPLP
jgi:hypothetical protein